MANQRKDASALKFEVVKQIRVLADNGQGTTKELALVKWGDNEPIYDLRKWFNGSPLKGITLTKEEAEGLLAALKTELG